VGDVVQARVEDGMLPAVYLPHTQLAAPMNVLVASGRGKLTIGKKTTSVTCP
jgi:hypothetical protein